MPGRDDPRIAQVGNFHPDVSYDAAAQVPAGDQVMEECWILAIAGYWGMCARDVEQIHYEIFEPRCRVPSGSRLQTARGEDGNTRPLFDPPWVEYISEEDGDWELQEGERWGTRPNRVDGSEERYLKRRNCEGNLALVQRVTWVPKLVIAITQVEYYLIGRYGEDVVRKWEDDILHVCGWF